MSLSAMLIAVRNQLRTACSFSNSECDVQNDPMPYPTAGRRVITVYPGECRGGPHSDQGIHEWIGINVGITLRLSGTPNDAITSEIFLKTLTGIEALSRKVMVAVHRNYAVMAAANAIIATANDVTADPDHVPPIVAFTTDKFITALEWRFTTPVPEVKLGDWFSTDNPDAINRKHGLFVNIQFVDSHRPQQILKMR
jgi:hypothetical protein